ncbi:ATP-binding protein [Spirulina sp. CS-785/01]|uniref:ATP-binding protein n=1 Tax=Spirulina sp. CS-785/01 TaxID=3021716 RepID=UPI00232AD7AA|nr:ATP-binding protein [Spirulina sp. CS-785/01]MDB9313131.1 ATP-binding protein [Spirulina sp. CS-785/01]
MRKIVIGKGWSNLVSHLDLIREGLTDPTCTLTQYLDQQHIAAIRATNAAVINISGRQRMLTQRTAFFALRLVTASNPTQQTKIRQELEATLRLLEQSHQALIFGDDRLNVSGVLSPEIKKIYFAPPLNLDQELRAFIAAGYHLVKMSANEFSLENYQLNYIIKAAESSLLFALDQAVAEYQRESEERDQEIEQEQTKFYQQSCHATALAEAKAKELQKTVQTLQNTQLQLIQAEKLSSLGQLIAGIAHEINNPLQFLSGNLHYALQYSQDLLEFLTLQAQHLPQPLPNPISEQAEDIELEFIQEDLPKLLTSMRTGVERIQEIIANLRNFSRLEQKDQQWINLQENIEGTLLLLKYRLKHQCNDNPVAVIKDYQELPLVRCYGGLLSQVFMNLIGNALDALEDAEHTNPKIYLKTEQVNSERVAISICDNGPGISEETQGELFSPFFTTKPVGKGTGLGLSISQQIIERHQGRLICNSTLGEGTEFRIEIPVNAV